MLKQWQLGQQHLFFKKVFRACWFWVTARFRKPSHGSGYSKAFLKLLLPLHQCHIRGLCILFEYYLQLLVVCKRFCCLRSCRRVVIERRRNDYGNVSAYLLVCCDSDLASVSVSFAVTVKHMSENTVVYPHAHTHSHSYEHSHRERLFDFWHLRILLWNWNQIKW